MGQVYRATDNRLGREVALKVLPPGLALVPERLARFEREARLLASLNHPNIAHLYGFESALAGDGTLVNVLAMELVEGEDLKARLRSGAIPVAEAAAIAVQVAAALEAAHDKGIVHRDIKPANVKLTPEGKVKVLDFGLAKASPGEEAAVVSSTDSSESPTLVATATSAGMIVGTAAYMSPEQARGKEVDRRTDIWAFGVLLFEMLTGRRLFEGETMTDVLAAVVRQEIDWSTLPPDTPPHVRRLLRRCLDRDPRRRLRDIGEARVALGGETFEAEAPPLELEAVVGSERRARARERRAWAALAAGLTALVGYLVFERGGSPGAAHTAVRFVLETSPGLAFPDLDAPAISPDGRLVAFTGLEPDGSRRLWLRALDAPEARPLPGSEGAGNPFWSPDSAEVAFTAAGELRRLALASGSALRLCRLPRERFTGGTWNEAGTIVFSAGGPSATLYQVPAAGGDASPLTALDASRAEAGHWWPQFLPGGRSVLFQVGSAREASAGLHALTLDAPQERRRVLPERGRFVYAAGHLLSVQGGTLVARRFDARRLEPASAPVQLAAGVATWANDPRWGWFSAAADGRVAWLSERDDTVRLEWIDRSGAPLGALGQPGRYSQIALSPDGRRVAVEVRDAEGRYDIWLIDVGRGVASRLTNDPADERDPVWSPDGREVVFASNRGGDQDLLRKSLQETEPAAPLPGGAGATQAVDEVAESWPAAGNTLVFLTLGEPRTAWALTMDQAPPAERVVQGRSGIDEPHVSPDGRWLAYVSTDSGRHEVYVEPFRRRGETVRVSSDGGGQPRWRRDGSELYYLSLDGRLVAASVREGAAGPQVGAPATLVPAERLRALVQGPDYDDYDAAADGRRFLVKRPVAPRQPQRIHVLVGGLATVPGR